MYKLFLEEQMINFQLSRITRGLNPSLNNPQEFYATFKLVPMAFQNIFCELYVHNLPTMNDTEWNSFLYVGDVQFRAVMS